MACAAPASAPNAEHRYGRRRIAHSANLRARYDTVYLQKKKKKENTAKHCKKQNKLNLEPSTWPETLQRLRQEEPLATTSTNRLGHRSAHQRAHQTETVHRETAKSFKLVHAMIF